MQSFTNLAQPPEPTATPHLAGDHSEKHHTDMEAQLQSAPFGCPTPFTALGQPQHTAQPRPWQHSAISSTYPRRCKALGACSQGGRAKAECNSKAVDWQHLGCVIPHGTLAHLISLTELCHEPADAEQGKTQVLHRCLRFPSWCHSIPAEAAFYANQSPHPPRQAWFHLLLMCHLHGGTATLQSVYLDFTQHSFGARNTAD